MGEETYQALAKLLADLARDYPHWREGEIVSQLRRAMPEYAHGIWRVALPFNQGESQLSAPYRERFKTLRQEVIAVEQVDLAHVLTSIDVHQSLDIIRDAYASWAGDLGTHVLANMARQARVAVGSADSMAGLPDLHGDIDGDNIARHMPDGGPLTAIVAYYGNDESGLDGVVVSRRFTTFAGDQGLLNEQGMVDADAPALGNVLRKRTREFITLDELELAGHHPLRFIAELFDADEQAQIDALLDTALDQFLVFIVDGIARERTTASGA